MDISAKIAELKQKPGFTDQVGMILIHNGVVRGRTRKDKKAVKSLEITPDQGAIEDIRREYLKKPGIFEIIIETEAGVFFPGDDMLFIIVAGDLREHVKPVLAEVLDRVKSGPVAKKEILA